MFTPKKDDKEKGGLQNINGILVGAVKFRQKARKVQQQTQSLEAVRWHLHDVGMDMPVHRGSSTSRDNVDGTEDAQKLPFLIFHPYATWRLCWDAGIMCLLLYSLVSVPVRIAFEKQAECNPDFWSQPYVFYADLIMDGLFMLDVLVTFRTAYFDVTAKRDKLITSQLSIAIQYVKGFLIIDVVSSIPFDLILITVCNKVNGANRIIRSPKALKLIRLVRFLRVLRVSRLRLFLRKIHDMLSINPGLLRLVYFLLLVCLFAHYNACIIFFIGELHLSDDPADADDPQNNSWTVYSGNTLWHSWVFGDLRNYTVHELESWQQYLVSLYWMVTTMCTIGWGDITPVTTSEVAYIMLVLIQGGATFSYMVGNMADLVSRIDRRQMRYKDSMSIWEHFMHRENLPRTMRTKIRSFKEHQHQTRLETLPSFARSELSKTLLRDITAHIYREALHSLKIFKGLDEHCLTELALALKPIHLPPGEVIYREGDYGKCMYFLHTGEVEFTMLLMTESQKSEYGIHLAENTIFSDSFLYKYGEQQPMPKNRKRMFFFTPTSAQFRWVGHKKVKARNFSWSIQAGEGKTQCFGENVLTTHQSKRLSTALTKEWCIMFKLEKEDLRQMVQKMPAMQVVWRKMKSHKATRLMRAVHRIVQGMNNRFTDTSKLLVVVKNGENLPRMDGFLGKCDAFVTLRLGEPSQGHRVYHTTIQYSTFNPDWDETFMFPIEGSRGSMPPKIYISVWDHNLVGQHQLIGEIELDVSEVCWTALESGQKTSRTMSALLRKTNTTDFRRLPTSIKGGSNKPCKINFEFHAYPPGDGDEAVLLRRFSGTHTHKPKTQGATGREADVEVEERHSPTARDLMNHRGSQESIHRTGSRSSAEGSYHSESASKFLNAQWGKNSPGNGQQDSKQEQDDQNMLNSVKSGRSQSADSKGAQQAEQEMLMLMGNISEQTGESLFAFEKKSDGRSASLTERRPVFNNEDYDNLDYKRMFFAIMDQGQKEQREAQEELESLQNRVKWLESLASASASPATPARSTADSSSDPSEPQATKQPQTSSDQVANNPTALDNGDQTKFDDDPDYDFELPTRNPC